MSAPVTKCFRGFIVLASLTLPSLSHADIVPTYVLTNMSTYALVATGVNQDFDTDSSFRLSGSPTLTSDNSYAGAYGTTAVSHSQAGIVFDIFGGGNTFDARGEAHGSSRWNGGRTVDSFGNVTYYTTYADAEQAALLQVNFTLTSPYTYTLLTNASGLTPDGAAQTDAYVKLYDSKGSVMGGAGPMDLTGVLDAGNYFLLASTSGGRALADNQISGVTDAAAAFDSEWQLHMDLAPVPLPPAAFLLLSGLVPLGRLAFKRKVSVELKINKE